MKPDLFRPEVIDAQRNNRQTGGILLAQSLPLWSLTLSILTVTVMVILFLLLGEFTRKEKAYGITIPGRGAIRLTAQEPGFIHAMQLFEGEQVAEGDLLFEIRQDKFSDLGETRQLIEASLESRSEKLASEIENRLRQENINIKKLQARAEQLRQEIASLDIEIKLQERQVVNAKRLVENLRPLFDERIIPEVQYQQQVSTHLEQQARLESLRRNQLGLKANHAETLDEMRVSKLRAEAEQSKMERNMLVNEQLQLEQRGAHVSFIRAPVSGTVSNILVDVGLPVEPGSAIATILPDGVQLEAQLFIPSNAIGFLRTGQQVKLRYDAFPYQKFGVYEGELTELASINVPMHEIEMRLPRLAEQYQGMTFFKAAVRLDRQAVQAYGQAVPLRAGLTLEADILLERKALIEWVFDPLFALGKRL
jgi:membrane fusion protein